MEWISFIWLCMIWEKGFYRQRSAAYRFEFFWGDFRATKENLIGGAARRRQSTTIHTLGIWERETHNEGGEGGWVKERAARQHVDRHSQDVLAFDVCVLGWKDREERWLSFRFFFLVCVYIYIYVYVYIYQYICICMYVYMYMYMYRKRNSSVGLVALIPVTLLLLVHW